jgi:hypothetical protein
MALFDNRVFSHEGKWWVAEIHGRVGSAFENSTPVMRTEVVIFTPLSEAGNSRSTTIPANRLRSMSHGSLVRKLLDAEPSGKRYSSRPVNAPPEVEQYKAERDIVTDDEGLRWVLLASPVPQAGPTGAVRGHEGVDVICLDDSAMRHLVSFDESTSC